MKNIWPKHWEVTELEKVASAVSGCSYQVSDYPYECLNEITIVEKITDVSLTLSTPKYMRITERELVKYRLRKGDIIFSHRNSIGQIGKSFLFDLNEKVIHTDRFFRIRTNEDYDSRFLDYVFTRSKDAGLFSQMAHQNGHTHHITLSQLRNLTVPALPLLEQKEFIERLSTYSEEAWPYYF